MYFCLKTNTACDILFHDPTIPWVIISYTKDWHKWKAFACSPVADFHNQQLNSWWLSNGPVSPTKHTRISSTRWQQWDNVCSETIITINIWYLWEMSTTNRIIQEIRYRGLPFTRRALNNLVYEWLWTQNCKV
jgi:hypothetical protein